MFGLQRFLGRRQRPAEVPAEVANQQPPPKKIKTGNNNAAAAAAAAAALLARRRVFSVPGLLGNIVSFLDHHEELQLAACNLEFYVFFHKRAAERLGSICREADPRQESEFVTRTLVQAGSILPAQDRQRFFHKTGEKPNYWQSLWMWWRGERPHRWIQPWRYTLQCAYMVPVDLQGGFVFGPSCSYGDRLYFLASAGIVITMDAEPKPVDTRYTRKAEGNLFWPGYCNITNKLWFCATNNNHNVNSGKGFLVLKHQPSFRDSIQISVMDLSQTNQDVGRADSQQTGMDHRRITPSGTFHDEDGNIHGEVVVSERDGLIFFVGGFDGTLSIESYDMTGQRVASEQKVAGTTAAGGGAHAHTKSVVTQDKLVIVYHTEEESAGNDLTGYGFGIYVFDYHDLSFCGYAPYTHCMTCWRISEDWIFFRGSGVQSDSAWRITGGNVAGQPTTINLGNNYSDILIAGNHIYTHKTEEEGNIEFDQFDLSTGNKIRTLRTNIPWQFDDDGTAHLPLAGPAVDGTVRRLSRTIVNAHVVGNKVVFIISSQGSAKNSIVTFALPPSP